jgi:hypothetical protein
MGSGASSIPDTVDVESFKNSVFIYQKLANLADGNGQITKQQLIEWSNATADDAEKDDLIKAFRGFKPMAAPAVVPETPVDLILVTSSTDVETSHLFDFAFTDSEIEAIQSLDMETHSRPMTVHNAVVSTTESASMIARLAASDLRAAKKLGDGGVCENILNVMQLNYVREDLVRESLKALVAISTVDEWTLRRLSADVCRDSSVYDLIVKLFNQYSHFPVIMNDLSKLVWLFCSKEDNRAALGSQEMIDVMLKALAPYCEPSDPNLQKLYGSICEQYCRVVTAMASDHHHNRMRLGRSGAHNWVILSMRSYMGQFGVQAHGMKALVALTEGDPTNRNLVGENAQFIQAVYWAMENYIATSTSLTEDGLCVIVHLCESEKYRRRLGDGDISEVVQKAMVVYATSRSVTVLGCKTIAMLLLRMPDTRVKMGDLGFCEIVVKGLHHYQIINDDSIAGQVDSGLRCESLVIREQLEAFENTNEELIAGHACEAIAYLAFGNQKNKVRLRDAGALVAVMEALRGFCRSLFVVERGCRAVCELAKDNETNKDLLGANGVAEFLLIAVKAHNNSPALCEIALRAVCVLVQDHPHNRRLFGTLAACSMFIVDAMRSHLDYHAIAEWGCLAMVHLAVDSPDNVVSLDAVGAVPSILGALQTHKIVSAVLVAGCKAVCHLTANSSCHARLKEGNAMHRMREINTSEKSGKEVVLWSGRAMEAMARRDARRSALM